MLDVRHILVRLSTAIPSLSYEKARSNSSGVEDIRQQHSFVLITLSHFPRIEDISI